MYARALTVLFLVAGQAIAQPQPADRAAYLRAEIQKARAEFVDTAAAVSGVDGEKIWSWMPKTSKLNAPEWKLIFSIERARGGRLSDAQRRAIMEADARKNMAIDRARLESLRRKP